MNIFKCTILTKWNEQIKDLVSLQPQDTFYQVFILTILLLYLLFCPFTEFNRNTE